MIERINRTFILTQAQKDHLISFGILKVGDWDRQDKTTKEIKSSIMAQMTTIQKNNCAYCGLKVGEGGRGELDHIANKARYAQFSFLNKNICLSCQYCNSSSKKWHHNVVMQLLPNYEDSLFTIVHPYLDDPNIDYYFCYSKLRVIIIALSEKGKESVRMFGLNEEGHITARAKQILYEENSRKYNLSQSIKNKIIQILTFKS